jgi:hypothetical protein
VTRFFLLLFCCALHSICFSQPGWKNADADFGPLPSGVHVFSTKDSLDGKPNVAYYVSLPLRDKKLEFTVDTTLRRRLTPAAFYEKNQHPLIVVNCTFFSFESQQNLNVVVRNGRLAGYNIHSIAGRGKDTLRYFHPTGSALGISKKRKADVAWLFTDSARKYPAAFERNPVLLVDSVKDTGLTRYAMRERPDKTKWKMQTAVGGGPVLLFDGEIRVTNNEERKFTGKAINDKHPRTAMGYTGDGRLVILVVEGRRPGIAEGATLIQEARLLKEIGCIEALNLDGGGSSCLLINGKQTIKPSDKEGQRPAPAVFIVKSL